MNRIMSYIILASMLYITPIKAQFGEILDQFELTEVDGKVHIQIIIKSGGICNGIGIYRSVDHNTYKTIGEIPGICGFPDVPARFEFTDEKPEVNRISYYKLNLGGLGLTEGKSITVLNTQGKKFAVIGNPASENVILLIDNDNGEDYSIELFDLTGKKVLSHQTKEDQVKIDVRGLSSGLYFFTILHKNTKDKATGSVIINRH
jgi:hypothetical protein